MSSISAEIESHKVKSANNEESVELKTFWQEQTAVIIFFRRWGCMLCRLWAKELSEIVPVLARHNIKLVGVGLEKEGIKDFIDGNYFNGELYYVENLSTYSKLGFKRFNVLSIVASLFWKDARDSISKARSMDVPNDFKGDKLQQGGVLIVEKGGSVLCKFAQTGPGHHMSNEQILKTLGLEHEYKSETMGNVKPDGDVCNTEAK